LTIRLLLRKRFGKLITNSKGFSSVIGTTFMVLVMMFLGTSVFMWTLSQNTLYNEAVRTRNQEEADRRNEGVVALGGNYSVSEDYVSVLAVLKNAGSVTAQLVNLWVLDTNQSKYVSQPLNLNLNPGDIKQVMYTVPIPETHANNTFASWFVTARGNTVPLEREFEGVTVAEVAQGIGKVGMDFDTFVYYHVISVGDGTYGLQEYPDGIEAFSIPKEINIAFRAKLTNYDVQKRTINLNSHSVLWMIFPTQPQQVRCAYWYAVNVDDTGTVQDTFSTISMPYGIPTTIYFASIQDLGAHSFEPSNTGKYDGPAAVFLCLFGTVGAHGFGQNIPFVSVYCS
jgi:archaellum component FlaF (FlaF/FlaG flagellin family)